MESYFLHQHGTVDCQCLVSQECNCPHIPDEHGTPEPLLCLSLPLHLDQIPMEMRMPR
jgi:hypothetical protein